MLSSLMDQKKVGQAKELEQQIVKTYPWSEEATDINWDGFWSALHNRRWNLYYAYWTSYDFGNLRCRNRCNWLFTSQRHQRRTIYYSSGG